MQNHIHCNNTITEAQKAAWMREGAERERERIRQEVRKLRYIYYQCGIWINLIDLQYLLKNLEATP